ncbi:MAG: replication protein [Circoviridae sp.]|nr:MAG: replication protein [Circoviridae sp.]
MEDTLVKPGLMAYQFRVDVAAEEGLTLVMQWMQKYDVQYYIVGAEVSDSGKNHFQCILWFKELVNTTKLRNWWKGKTLATKQPVSMTSAKKIKNLSKYTMKEKNFITNLTKEELDTIGKWKRKVKDAEWSSKLDEHCKKFSTDPVDPLIKVQYNVYQYSDYPKLSAFLSYMLDFYKVNNRRPSRATLQYLAWKHGHMSNNYLIDKWF